MMTYKNFRKQQKDRSLNRQVGTTASDQSSNIGYIRAYVKYNSFDWAPASEFESIIFQLLLEHFLPYRDWYLSEHIAPLAVLGDLEEVTNATAVVTGRYRKECVSKGFTYCPELLGQFA